MGNLIKRYRFILFLRIYLAVIYILSDYVNVTGQSYTSVIYDKQQTEYFGAVNLITLQKAVSSFQEKYVPDTLFAEKNFFRKVSGFGYRMGKLFILDFQEDFFISLIQHEAFGHGARYREFGHQKNSYNLSPFFPFGTASGFAYSGQLKPGERITPHESITKIFSGNEANLLLANTLSLQFILNDTVHYREALLYLISQNNQFEYIWKTRLIKPKDPVFGSGDISSYISGINSLYGNGVTNNYTIDRISVQSLLSIANPVQIYSLYTIMFQYGYKGKKQLSKIPMIKIGNTQYLPLFNYNLTPFGSEYLFSNLIRHKKRLYCFDFSLGDNTFNKFYGTTVKIFNVIDNQRININLNGAIWNQPELELENPLIRKTSNKAGGSVKIEITLRPIKMKSKLGILLQTGYKTKGYLMGESLSETFILRYGFSFHF